MEFEVFKYKSPNFAKLAEFGFENRDGEYTYRREIFDNQFEMRVRVASSGEVFAEVIDAVTGDPYTLHLIADASGAFVGRVREEYEGVLQEIADKCFFRDVFKEDIARKVIEYVRERYGDELEFLWEKTPAGAIWRRKDNRKWYGILMIISKRKLGLNSDDQVTVIDLRLDPDNDGSLADGKKIFQGYHMNKRTWFTMCLDGSVPFEDIKELIDKSYVIARTKYQKRTNMRINVPRRRINVKL